YTRDPVGNLTRIQRNGSLDTFEYDELYRLTRASLPGVGSWWFRYDHTGNRVEMIHNGQTTTYSCDSANCVTTINGVPVEHDANGHVTSVGWGSETYTWDVRGRLVRLVKGGATYEFQYDPFGLRTGKKAGGVWTYYLLDGESVVKEITGSTSTYTTQGPLLDQPLGRGGRYFTPNHLGSTTTLTDGSGTVVQSYQYGPFGETSQSTGEANPFQ
ncbi:MAG: hypothetical protein QN175_13830, partial [Armatimonadota bacterium]|nr:hypothetical protein [Armatimonadota bacterium]